MALMPRRSTRSRSGRPRVPRGGLAVYIASGSSLVPPAVSSRVPTGEIARPSVPPVTTSTTEEETTSEETTTEKITTTEDDSESGRGLGRGRGRSGDD